MKILGISCFYHDSAASLIIDGIVVAAAQEERFTRIKHDASFPTNAIQYCLEESHSFPEQIDAVVFYEKPLLKFERLLETHLAFAPSGLRSFLASIPVWLNEKMFFKRLIKKNLKELEFHKIPKLLFPEHHLSHAASAFYPSPFQEAAILTIDGVGEWATATISKGTGKNIKVIKELRFPHSLGLLYSAFTYFLGFRVNSGEYKLMGLAPYGNKKDEEIKLFENNIKNQLVDISDDGSIWLNQQYFNYATGLKMVNEKKWKKLFNLKKRQPEEPINQRHCNLALAIQNVTEEIVYLMAKEAQRLTGCEHLCMSGGVAMNCVSNGQLQRSKLFKNIFIQPASGDSGGSLGAALAAYHIYFDQNRIESNSASHQQFGALLGPAISEHELLRVSSKFNAVSHQRTYPNLYKEVAHQLSIGKVIGWIQGRMEFGARALGARSILADPRNPEMQKKLNLKIKNRESFRPFAPSVLKEDADQYFDMDDESPYMALVHSVHSKRVNEVPSNYDSWALSKKLAFPRSDIPAVTHVDHSARIQTVDMTTHPHFWQLLNAFKESTGCSVLINTSFNVRGEPIVCTAEDGYRCFMQTEMDILVMGSYIFMKHEQPMWDDKDHWKTAYTQD